MPAGDFRSVGGRGTGSDAHGGAIHEIRADPNLRTGRRNRARRSYTRGVTHSSTRIPFGPPLAEADPEIAAAIRAEEARQSDGLELIASENFASEAVLEATGSVMTNKYAEGYPGRRYYGGCVHVDKAERLARKRAKKLFGARSANVQAHSGTQANMVAYLALLEPGDTFLGMALDQGGHLTHGHPLNFSGKTYNPVPYGVRRDTEQLDLDELHRLAREHRPRMILVGASAYPRIFPNPEIREIADEVGARVVTDMAHIAGLVAGGALPNPMPHSDIVTTTTHKTLRGPRGGLVLWNDRKLSKRIQSITFPGTQGGPMMHTIAAKAVCFHEALQPAFRDYARQTVANARELADALVEGGFRVVSGGTDNHIVLLDVRVRGTTGRAAERTLEAAGITANKNTIPFDPEKPMIASGVRLGTAALTTRGMRETEMRIVASFMVRALDGAGDRAALRRLRGEVAEFASGFPLYTRPAR